MQMSSDRVKKSGENRTPQSPASVLSAARGGSLANRRWAAMVEPLHSRKDAQQVAQALRANYFDE